MFGWFKQKATELQQARGEVVSMAAGEAAKFMMEVQGVLGGVPRKMLDDPFIVGAIAMYAAISLKVITNGQAANAQIESAMIKAIERTFVGKDVSQHDAISALMRFKNNPEYAKAAQLVTLILGARYERKDLINAPFIVEARAHVASTSKVFWKEAGVTEAEQVAQVITQHHFIKPLMEKYGELWRNGGET